MNPSIEDFKNPAHFELLHSVHYLDMRNFVIRQLGNAHNLLKAYSIFQMASLLIPFALIGYQLVHIFIWDAPPATLYWIVAAVGFSFTFLILIHELIHMLAFVLLGRKGLRIGGQVKKFIFYVEADREVLNKREYLFIAILPFVSILLFGVLFSTFFWGSNLAYFVLTFTSIHSLFCAGDMAIIAYMHQYKEAVFTYDDAKTKTAYFYREVRG